MTSALRSEAVRSGLRLDGSEASPRLESRIVRVKAVPRGVALHAGAFRTREQELVARIELSLVRDGQECWKTVLNGRESYLSAPDLRGTEANRNIALKTMIERLAREGIERLARGF